MFPVYGPRLRQKESVLYRFHGSRHYPNVKVLIEYSLKT